jgi:DNA-binding MarR family transcriptional regulator
MKVYQDRGLIEVKRSDDRHKRVEKLRITENGIKLAKVAWERYRKFASNLLAGVSQADIEAHCRVNDAISAAISAKRQNPWDGLAG